MKGKSDLIKEGELILYISDYGFKLKGDCFEMLKIQENEKD